MGLPDLLGNGYEQQVSVADSANTGLGAGFVAQGPSMVEPISGAIRQAPTHGCQSLSAASHSAGTLHAPTMNGECLACLPNQIISKGGQNALLTWLIWHPFAGKGSF